MVLEGLRNIFRSESTKTTVPKAGNVQSSVQQQRTPPLAQTKIPKLTLTNPLESKELILNIFSNLGVSELGLVAQVCKKWRQLSADNFLWEPFLAKAGVQYERTLSLDVSCKEEYRDLKLKSKLSPIPLKTKSYAIKCNEVSFVSGTRLVVFKKGVSVRVYELKTGELIGGAENNFLNVALQDDILATYSADKAISFWNIITKKCIFASTSCLNGKNITYLHLHGHLLFCASNEKEFVEVWDYVVGQKLASIDTYNKFVTQIETKDGLVVLTLDGFDRHKRDTSFLIYDPLIQKCIYTVSEIQSFAAWDFYGDSLYIGAKEKIIVKNIFTEEETFIPLPSDKRIIRLQIFKDKMVTITIDSQIHYWNLKTKKVMAIPKKNPDENIYKILLDDKSKRLIITSTQGIYVHDLIQSGKLIKQHSIEKYSYDSFLFPKTACTLFADRVLLTKLDDT